MYIAHKGLRIFIYLLSTENDFQWMNASEKCTDLFFPQKYFVNMEKMQRKRFCIYSDFLLNVE